MFVCLQAGDQQTCHGKDESTDQVQTHEINDQGLLIGGKPRCDAKRVLDQSPGEYSYEYGKGSGNQEGKIRDLAEYFPGSLAVLPCDDLGQDGDDGHSQRAA